MFFTGAGGCGKSTAVSLAEKNCHSFCQTVEVIFGDTTFYFTATTGSAAALWGGVKIHGVVYLKPIARISDDGSKKWEHVRIPIIDEISYF